VSHAWGRPARGRRGRRRYSGSGGSSFLSASPAARAVHTIRQSVAAEERAGQSPSGDLGVEKRPLAGRRETGLLHGDQPGLGRPPGRWSAARCVIACPSSAPAVSRPLATRKFVAGESTSAAGITPGCTAGHRIAECGTERPRGDQPYPQAGVGPGPTRQHAVSHAATRPASCDDLARAGAE